MQNLHKTSSHIWGTTLTIALLAIFSTSIGGCAQTTTVTPPAPTPPTSPATSSTKYTNGSYSATGSYVTPGGIEDLTVSVTLKNDQISAASFTGNPGGPISKKMQSQFKAGFQELVVGKSLDQVSLDVVNGASLTPKGFMDALAKIKVKART